MSWIALAILCHLSWAINNVGDKYLIEKKFANNPLGYLFFGFLTGAISLLSIIFIEFQWIGWHLLILIFIATLAYFIMCVLYIKAVQIEEISRIGIIWNILPFFTLSLAWIFLGEKLSFWQFFAFVLLCLGAVISSIQSKKDKIAILSRALLYMALACAFEAVYVIVFKYVTWHTSFANAFLYFSFFLPLLAVLLFLKIEHRQEIKNAAKNLTWLTVAMIFIISILSRAGVLFNNWALSLGPVALVNSIEGVQTIFVFIITILLTIFLPKILKEDLSWRNIMLKVVAIIFMISGILILYLK